MNFTALGKIHGKPVKFVEFHRLVVDEEMHHFHGPHSGFLAQWLPGSEHYRHYINNFSMDTGTGKSHQLYGLPSTLDTIIG